MTTERWQQIEALFEAACAEPPEARTAFLDAACVDADGQPDPALREEVASLLAAADAPGVVDRLVGELATPRGALDRPAAEGRRVGPYRLERLLGRGGMGAVYLAVRADGQFEQRVALKVIREGLDAAPLRARFLRERQMLARLQHPRIARLLDGGLDDDGRPFFAMEVVDGERLDHYCDTHRLDVHQRLRLFGEVCEAVQYAHQNLVLHRDLKPSNILVTDGGNGQAHVKLLDFGVAKLLENEEGEAQTQTGLRAMTPEYAAPEQVRGEPVSTAADVYSLGVVLYELLTGHRPYAVRDLSPGEFERVVCETEPPRPSTVVTRVVAVGGDGQARPLTPETISAARATEPDTLARRLAGDLDTICLKALQKEPARRYASAGAFLEDIKRHLAGLPVQARPDTPGYRARKFVQRHRAGVAAAVLVLLTLVAGLAGTAWQAREAARERDRAQGEAVKAEEALDLLVNLFEQSDPAEAAGEALSAREVLERAEARLAGFEGSPAVEATLLDALGRVYERLGLYDRAGPLLERALALRRADASTPPEDRAASLYHLGVFYHASNAFDRAEPLLRDALVLQRETLGDAHPATATTEHMLGQTLSTTGRASEARLLLERALATRRARYDATHEAVQESTNELALLLHRNGNMAAAESLFAEAVRHGERLPDRTHPTVMESLQSLARLRHRFRRDYAGAEPLYHDVLAMGHALYDANHPNVATANNDLAQFYRDRGAPGDLARAETYARAAIAIWLEQFGPVHRETAVAQNTLAAILRLQGRFDEAEAIRRETLAVMRSLFGDGHMAVISGTISLADLMAERGSAAAHAEAARLYREALATSRAQFGEDHAYTAITRQGLARLRLEAGDPAGAERLYREALAIRQRLYPGGHWSVAAAESQLARSLIALGRYDEAERLLLTAHDALEAHDRRSTSARSAREGLVSLYEAWGRPQDAARWRTRPEETGGR